MKPLDGMRAILKRLKRAGDGPVDMIHVGVLCGFAFAQPLYDLLSRSGELFVVRRMDSVDILLLVGLLSVALPLALVLFGGLAGLLGERWRRNVHRIVVGVLVSVVAMPVLNRAGVYPVELLILVSAVLGGAVATAYVMFKPVRMLMTGLAPALIVFPVMFLLSPAVGKVLFPKPVPSFAVPDIATDIPIVMVVFDELPLSSLLNKSRKIDPVRYPHWAELAGDSHWFRNATAVSWTTGLALPAIVTGNYPDVAAGRLATVSDYPRNLFTILRRSHELNVWEHDTQLSPRQVRGDEPRPPVLARAGSIAVDLAIVFVHIILPAETITALPPVIGAWGHFAVGAGGRGGDGWDDGERRPIRRDGWRGSGRLEFFRGFIDSIRPGKRPGLHFIHLELPHVPYRYLPSGRRYGAMFASLLGVEAGTEQWNGDERGLVQAWQRHLLQVGFVDRLLGELMRKLKRVGLYDRALIVVTSDHGSSFRMNDSRRRITPTNYSDIILVPLLVKLPHQRRGVVSDRNVEAIDIVPTIADVLECDCVPGADGHSLLDSGSVQRAGKTVYLDDPVPSRFPNVIDPGATVDRQSALFGSSAGWDALFRLEFHRELLGKPVSAFEIEKDGKIEIDLAAPETFNDVDLASGFIPAGIWGRAHGDAAGGVVLAISVNGKIRAVTRTVRQRRRWSRFSALVPESSFRNGRNTVDIFVVRNDGGRSTLFNATGGSFRTYSLQKLNDGREVIACSDGRSMSVIPGLVRGRVDESAVIGDRIVFTGWAADVDHSRPVEMIVIFADGNFLKSGRTFVWRDDIKRIHGVEMTGFHFKMPRRQVGRVDGSAIRFFGISDDGTAAELSYHDGYRWRE